MKGGVTMGFLSIFSNSNSASASEDSILKNPGDRAEARITNSGRKVVKISVDNGKTKYSATKYKNGTTVETKTTKQ